MNASGQEKNQADVVGGTILHGFEHMTQDQFDAYRKVHMPWLMTEDELEEQVKLLSEKNYVKVQDDLKK